MLLSGATLAVADGAGDPPIELKLRPRVCTLSDNDTECNTTVRAQWRSPRNESLCLVIVDRPGIKRCWEDHRQGVYAIELAFSEDLVVQLRDAELDHVLASQAIAVIRQALQFRRKRRQPWNIFSWPTT
ncbi:MAG: DUF3019 domain-containing protein [Steroidobacteraceae bacterium]